MNSRCHLESRLSRRELLAASAALVAATRLPTLLAREQAERAHGPCA